MLAGLVLLRHGLPGRFLRRSSYRHRQGRGATLGLPNATRLRRPSVTAKPIKVISNARGNHGIAKHNKATVTQNAKQALDL